MADKTFIMTLMKQSEEHAAAASIVGLTGNAACAGTASAIRADGFFNEFVL